MSEYFRGTYIPYSPDNADNAHEMQMQSFSRRIMAGAFNKLTIFLAPRPSSLPPVPSRLRQDAEESFIDEIVNTFDGRRFCRPFGRLSVAIGDHPMRPVSSTRCKKDLSPSLSDHCLPDHLNVTFSFLICLPFESLFSLPRCLPYS